MARRGNLNYVPRVVIDEYEDIMREKEIRKKHEGYRKMVEYCRVGREVERIVKLDWSKKRKKGWFGGI